MTTPAFLVQIVLDPAKFARWCVKTRLDGEDIGYACHALLCDVYGEHRLRPYHVDQRPGRLEILGYSTVDSDTLRAWRGFQAPPDQQACILSESSRPIPMVWPTGLRIGFQTRLCPTRQQSQAGARSQEKDAFLLDKTQPREDVYRTWLQEKLVGAASVTHCQMVSFRLFKAQRLAVRPTVQTDGDKAQRGKIVKQKTVPDAVLSGVLHVEDGALFRTLLLHGIGRQRSFGFGALLLKPTKPNSLTVSGCF